MTMLRIERDDLLAEPSGETNGGFGAIETAQGRLPLTALDVGAQIAGLVAHITVEQTFRNALDVPLEATYIFPLPDRAAVTSFRMQVGQRIIEAELKERGQARADYDAAIQQGFRAAIAEEERSGTFNLRVGNIPPHESVTVKLTLVGPLPVAGGEATFRFPLVVAPRYVPGIPLDGPQVGAGYGFDTDQVPDASRVTPPVLLPGFPNPVRLGLQVEIDPAGILMPQSALRSSLHTVIVSDGPPWTVRLEPGERLDRDFILRIPVCAAEVRSTLQCGAGAGDSSVFGLTLVPPAVDPSAPRPPRDVVVLLDRSGSMGGWKMVAARRAVGRIVDTLLDHDRFTILAFDDSIDYPTHAKCRLIPGTNQNRWKAVQWLGKVDARGGTELGPAVDAGAGLLRNADAQRTPVMIIVTDGEVAGEDAVLRSLQSEAGGRMPRIHTLGIDRAVNQGFLQRLADLGQGTCDVVESEGRLDQAMDHIHSTIATPALTQLRLEPIGWQIEPESLAPERLPDLFIDRPVMIFGRCPTHANDLRLRIQGLNANGRIWQQEVLAQKAPAEMLTNLWGRVKVRELEDRYAADGRGAEQLQRRIVRISLASKVLSRFTAYVAVDRSAVVNVGGKQHKVVQPVEMPEGWDEESGEASQVVARCCDVMLCETDDLCGADSMLIEHDSVADGTVAYSGASFGTRRGGRVLSAISKRLGRVLLGQRTPAEIIVNIRTEAKRLEQANVSRGDAVKLAYRLVVLFNELQAALAREGRKEDAELVEEFTGRVCEIQRTTLQAKSGLKDQHVRVTFAAEIGEVLAALEADAKEPRQERTRFWT